jgi:hypothetical protein
LLKIKNNENIILIKMYLWKPSEIQNGEANNMQSPKSKYKIKCRATRTPEKCKGRTRCPGAASLLY